METGMTGGNIFEQTVAFGCRRTGLYLNIERWKRTRFISDYNKSLFRLYLNIALESRE